MGRNLSQDFSTSTIAQGNARNPRPLPPFSLWEAHLSRRREHALFSDGRRDFGSDGNGMGFGNGASHPTRSLVPPRIILPHGTLFVPIFLLTGKITRGAMRPPCCFSQNRQKIAGKIA